MATKRQLSAAVLRSLEATSHDIPTLRDEFLRYGYEVEQHPINTMRPRTTQLKFFVEFCFLNGIDDVQILNNPVIELFIVEYGKTRAKSTVNSAIRTLKVFFKWIHEYKEIDTRVREEAIRFVKEPKKLPRSIDDPIIARVIRETEEEQDKLIIATFRESGVRISELVNIRVSHLRKTAWGYQIAVIGGKGDIDRHVNITSGLAYSLKKYAEDQKRLEDDWLFQTTWANKGGKMTIKAVRERVQRAFALIAGIKMTPHQLRHSMAIGMLENGANLVTIQKQLGHADIQTTMKYLRVGDQMFQESYALSTPTSFLYH